MKPKRRFCGLTARSGLVFIFSSVIALLAAPAIADDARLNERQSGLASRYQQLEELLLRLAEVEAAENPERSALLRRAARQSRDKFVLEKMRTASDSLQTEEFQKAVDNQSSARTELSSLLKLLMSEDRSKRIRDEKERYANIAKELKRAMRAQQSTRARTENGAELDEVQGEQKSISDRTEKLADRLSDEEPSESSPEANSKSGESKESKSGESKPGDKKEAGEKEAGEEKEPGEKEADEEKEPGQEEADGEKEAGEKGSEAGEKEESSESEAGSKSSSEQKPGSKSQQSESQQSESQQSESQQSESQQSESQQSQSEQKQSDQNQQPQTPEQQVEEQLRKAIEKMREAEEKLGSNEREKATDEQRAAEEELRAAIDRLERILRQLREEEMQRELAKLESRLRKMATMQAKVLDDTVELAATPTSQRNRQTDLKAGDLAFEEKKITMEADRAMLLLREEGSSVAFPEVVSQISRDTVLVADRLAEAKIDIVTQGIQKDILAALEEMIAATQKAQRDLEKKSQQQQGKPQQGGQQEEPLVEAIAELRLIRTMETRIKSTTERYAGLVETGEQGTEDVLPLLRDLSERQNRLYRITRDLVLKRNK